MSYSKLLCVWSFNASCLFLVLQKLGLEKVSILGWSDGGISAMIAAAKYPNIVQNIVIWGSNAYITQKDLDKYNSKLQCSR